MEKMIRENEIAKHILTEKPDSNRSVQNEKENHLYKNVRQHSTKKC